MATVNLGRIKFVWQGAYSGATAYVADDVVSYNGSSYICILASTGNLPTNTTYWSIMSSAGTNGTNGTDVGTTITTQGDILYRNASGLARLGAGTSGQYLKTNGSGANPQWSAVSAVLKKIHVFSYNTRTAGSGSANTDQFTWTSSFTPLDAVNNDLVIQSIVPINGAGNNFMGFGLRFTGNTTGTNYDNFGKGSNYASYSDMMGMSNNIFHISANTMTNQTYTVKHRTETASSNPDFYFLNSSDDARIATQTIGYLIITEYAN